MLETIATWTNGIIAIGVVLGACIFIHELGHFAVAKLIGMRVEEFAIGFGRRLWGFERGETTYRLNLFPLGGYVRIAGMEPGAEPVERGFHTFPRWMGTTVLLAGSVMNVVLAALAFIAIGVMVGVPVFPADEVQVRKVMRDSPGQAAGVKPGDRIVAVDGIDDSLLIDEVTEGGAAERAGLDRYDHLLAAGDRQLSYPSQLLDAMLAAVKRGEGTVQVEVVQFTEEGKTAGSETLSLPIPGDLPEESATGEAGEILEDALGLRFVPLTQNTAVAYISGHPGKRMTLTVQRDGRRVEMPVTPESEWARVPTTDEEGRQASEHRAVGRIGVVLQAESRKIPVAEAVYYGVQSSVDAVEMVARGIYAMIVGEAAMEAAGPVAIAAITVDRARIGWTAVATIGGIISANLAVINMFPIPPFDGFRIVLLAIEAVIGRRVNERIEIGVTVAGFAVILAFFLVITFRDILNLVFFRTP